MMKSPHTVYPNGGLQRIINLEYPDGTIHEVNVYRADIAYDSLTDLETVVISYIDYTDGNSDCYTEIVPFNGRWVKKPHHLEWNSYQFREFNPQLSDNIIRELPETIQCYNLAKERNEEFLRSIEKPDYPIALAQTLLPPDPPKPKPPKKEEKENYVELEEHLETNVKIDKEEVRLVAIVLEGVLENNPLYYQLPIFEDAKARKGILCYDRLSADPRNEEIVTNITRMNPGSSFDFELDDVIYHVRYSSCNDQELFVNEVCNAFSIEVPFTLSKISYGDYLSSGLHHELPITFVHGNNLTHFDTTTYEAVVQESNRSRR